MRGRDRWFLVLVLLVVGHFTFSASRLVYPQFELNYPFLGGDTWDWLSNGFAIAGHDVRYSARPPLVPLFLAFLEHFSMLELFPVVLQAIVHATTLGLYRHLVRDYPQRISFAVAIMIGFNFHWRSFSHDVMADVPATCLLAWSVFSWRRSIEWSGAYVPAGLMAGLSAVTQQAALLVPIPAFLSVWFFQRSRIRSRPFVVGGALFLFPTLCWTTFKYLTFGTVGDVLVRHWSLLAFRTDAIDDYLFGFVAYFGLPAAVTVGIGYVLLCHKARTDQWSLFLVCLVGALSTLFVFFYDHISIRFLTYVFLPCAMPLAEGLNRIRARVFFWPVVGTVVLGSLMPVPGGKSSGDATLWPLPPIFAQVPVRPSRNSGTAFEVSKLDLKCVQPAVLVSQSYEFRILSQKTKPLKKPFPYETVIGDDSVLFFHDPGAPTLHHNNANLRLAVQLRKRIKHIPWSTIPPDLFRQRVRVARVGNVEHYAIYRGWPAGIEGSWLLVAVSGGRVDRDLASMSREDVESPISPGPELSQARALSNRIGNDYTAIFLDPEGRDHWRLYLPFLLSTTEFFLIEPEEVPKVRRIWLEPAKILDHATVAGVRMTRYRILGRTRVVMENERQDSK